MAGEQATHASPLVLGFPAPGSRVQKAYHDLWEAQNGSEERKKKLGNPPTCRARGTRPPALTAACGGRCGYGSTR